MDRWQLAVADAGLCAADVDKVLSSNKTVSASAAAFLAGSVAEGLANSRSDVDICLLVEGSTAPLGDPRARKSLNCGEVRIDLQLVGRRLMDELLARFAHYKATGFYDSTMAEVFSEEERRLLHRLRTRLPIRGHDTLERLASGVSKRSLARLKLSSARVVIKRRQVDAEGLRGEGDWRSLLFCAREIADHCADALLAARGDTSVGPKWRIRRLAAEYADAMHPHSAANGIRRDISLPGPPQPAPAETYLALATLPAEPDAQTAIRYAERVVSWSRIALLFASSMLGDGARSLLTPYPAHRLGAPLPALALDVHLALAESRFALRRLGDDNPGWEVSPEAASLLCAFDGVTPRGAAVESPDGTPFSLRMIDSLIQEIRAKGLHARPIVDENILRKVLD